MKAILGIDGSEGSLSAVAFTGRILSPDKDSLAFYFATPSVQVDTSVEIAPEILERMRRDLTEGVLKQAENRLPAAWHGRVGHIPGTQDPRRGLIAAAKVEHADLIVVGARGLGPVTSWLMGSVSQAVVHASDRPVLVVRPPSHKSGKGPDGMRVLVACVHEEHGAQTAKLLSRFSWPQGTVGQAIGVVDTPFGNKLPEWLEGQVATSDEPDARSWLGRVQRESKERRDQLERQFSNLEWSFKTEPPIIREGNPAEHILEMIERDDVDLVVIGTRHPGLLARWLLGSTSERVLSHSNCSVLLVPHADAP